MCIEVSSTREQQPRKGKEIFNVRDTEAGDIHGNSATTSTSIRNNGLDNGEERGVGQRSHLRTCSGKTHTKEEHTKNTTIVVATNREGSWSKVSNIDLKPFPEHHYDGSGRLADCVSRIILTDGQGIWTERTYANHSEGGHVIWMSLSTSCLGSRT